MLTEALTDAQITEDNKVILIGTLVFWGLTYTDDIYRFIQKKVKGK